MAFVGWQVLLSTNVILLRVGMVKLCPPYRAAHPTWLVFMFNGSENDPPAQPYRAVGVHFSCWESHCQISPLSRLSEFFYHFWLSKTVNVFFV